MTSDGAAMDELDAIILNPEITAVETETRLARYLYGQADHGISNVVGKLAHTEEDLVARYLTRYLSLLHGHSDIKTAVVDDLTSRPHTIEAAAALAGSMPEHDMARFVAAYASGRLELESVVYEIGLARPDLIRSHAGDILADCVLETMWPGAPDELTDQLVARLRDEPDDPTLTNLVRVRTEHAIRSLARLFDEWSTDDADRRWLLANAGVGSSGEPSVALPAHRCFVVRRGTTPHLVGGDVPFPVPACPMCDRPAARLVTLNLDALPTDLGGTVDPSFFRPTCECGVLDYLYVRHLPDGVEGIMTTMTDGPVTGASFVEASLTLEALTNRHGLGVDFVPGFGVHQVGGYPPWIRLDIFPACPGCSETMRFAVAIDSGPTPFGPLIDDGCVYGFWCGTCSISATCEQRPG